VFDRSRGIREGDFHLLFRFLHFIAASNEQARSRIA
jgi:hypothetical protein